MVLDLYSSILNECRHFAANEIRPHILENDLSPDNELIERIQAKSTELDIPGLCIPEACNGAGFSLEFGALLVELLATECAGIASVFANHFTACATVAASPSDCRKPILSKLSDGSGFATILLPSDRADTPPCITGDGDSSRINGKTAAAAGAPSASGYLAFARKAADNAVVALWLDKGTPGVSVGKPLSLPGLKAAPHAPIVLDSISLADATVLGQAEDGEKLLATARHGFYGLVAAMAMGSARAAARQAESYARQRYQFGNVIIGHQEIRRMLGDMRMKLAIGTAGFLDLFSNRSARPAGHAPDAALTKAFCTDAALDIVLDAIQIHGGYGYMHEYGIEKRMRDIKVLQVSGETNPYLKVLNVSES